MNNLVTVVGKIYEMHYKISDDNGNFVCELCGRFKAKKVKVMSK